MAQLVEFVGNHVWLVTGLLAAWAAVTFYELRLRKQGATHVTAADAVRLINKGALVIDVRKPEEFAQGHIVNARNVPLERMQKDTEYRLGALEGGGAVAAPGAAMGADASTAPAEAGGQQSGQEIQIQTQGAGAPPPSGQQGP